MCFAQAVLDIAGFPRSFHAQFEDFNCVFDLLHSKQMIAWDVRLRAIAYGRRPGIRFIVYTGPAVWYKSERDGLLIAV